MSLNPNWPEILLWWLGIVFVGGISIGAYYSLQEWWEGRHERRRNKGIDVEPVYPAVPFRDHDWLATRKSYEPGDLQGWGATPEEAIENLHAQEHAR